MRCPILSIVAITLAPAAAASPGEVIGDLRRELDPNSPAWASDAEFRRAVDRAHSTHAGAQPLRPGGAPRPGQPDPRTLLLDKAFELERIAHELDVAERYAAADAVRGAAARVRGEARPPQPPLRRRDGGRRRPGRVPPRGPREDRPHARPPAPSGVFGGPHAEATDDASDR
ncbi:MAG: hypothetical protein AAF805_09425 [Planctomycetota bacterium]